jgi:hypothetical protein
MSVLRLDIEGNPERIPYRSFIQVANNSLAILDDLDSAYSRKSGVTLDWYVRNLSKNGSLRIEVFSQVKQMKRANYEDVSQSVSASFVTGFRALESDGRSPELLTERGMRRAKTLTHLIGHDGLEAVHASVPGTPIETEITRKSAANIDVLIPAASHSMGSVEGVLEVISIHRSQRFVIYQDRTNKAVTCFYGKLPLLDKVKGALGKRVVATGKLFRNAKNEPIRLNLESESQFKIFGNDDFPAYDLLGLGGSDPDFTGHLTTDQFIENIRG